jgi:RNase H-fold protein (predicted Holliday junction resolvase)
MFGRFRTNYEEQLRLEKERLQTMSEKELLIEMIMELKRIDQKCDDIARKIVIWSN